MLQDALFAAHRAIALDHIGEISLHFKLDLSTVTTEGRCNVLRSVDPLRITTHGSGQVGILAADLAR